MSEMPTGTVTFLFTDLEGSTKLARTYSDAWPMIQERLHELLRNAITTHQGAVFQIVGDEVDAAFGTALDALSAARAALVALQNADWGEVGTLRVRMGLHTGPATLQGDRYEGYVTISHAKRLMSVAYGGQILLSEATETLLRDALPKAVTLRDLGIHRLKDFERAEHIFQVVAQDLPEIFPPIKSLGGPPNNLPVQLTSFVGREREIGEVKGLLSAERLVTLLGSGGSGKTRLALQASAEMIDNFPAGVFFVALTPISDPGLVASTIAKTLGIAETPGRSMVDRLIDDLKNKEMLLLLDNFEQVVQAAPLVSDLLAACRDLKILVTSREGLRINGEREYPVLPLPVPDPDQLPSLSSLLQYAAVDLFLQRAKAVKPDFKITEDTAQAVAAICYRLDGLPLAIELAAARIKLLSPSAMLARLEHRLDFLTGGPRDLPARQQTLWNAIAWSYDLLNEHEQQLFHRLSVFVGGCTIDAAERVAGERSAQNDLLDLLGSLFDKSLLRKYEGTNRETRFGMLETLREFGLKQLEASGEEELIRYRHASFFLERAEQAEAAFETAAQVRWMNWMEQEHGNLRAALEWSQSAADGDAEKAENMKDIGLRLAGALGLFWEARGYFSEGRERLTAILASAYAGGQTAARAKLLARAAELAYRQSDYPATVTIATESLAISRAIGDRQGAASALIKLGNAATEVGDYSAASSYLEEALTTCRELEDKNGIARSLVSLGWVALRAGGDYHLAKERLSEALVLSRGLGDTRRIGFELAGLGEVALREGDYKRATQLVEESLALRRQLANKWGIGVSLGILGWIAMREQNWTLAMARLCESLEVRHEIGDQSGCAWCLERLAAVAQAQGKTEKAARLFGAAAALRASIRSAIDPADQPAYESKVRSLRKALGDKRFAAAWEKGRALTVEQAVNDAKAR